MTQGPIRAGPEAVEAAIERSLTVRSRPRCRAALTPASATGRAARRDHHAGAGSRYPSVERDYFFPLPPSDHDPATFELSKSKACALPFRHYYWGRRPVLIGRSPMASSRRRATGGWAD